MANTSQPLNASHIGNSFVLKYYTQLSENPENLFHFYKDHSVFTHGQEDEEGPAESVVGAEKINQKIQSLGFKNCHVPLSVVDCQESQDQGILIVVLGYISNNAGPYRKFTQTFFLARQTSTSPGVYYYVLNDVFRYLKEPGSVAQDDHSTKSAASNQVVENVAQPAKKEAEEPPKVEVAEKKVEAVKDEKKAEEKPAAKPQEPTTPSTSTPQQPATQQHSSKPASQSNKKNEQKKKNQQQASTQQSTQQSAQQPAQQAQSSTPSWANMASRLQGDKIAQAAPQQQTPKTATPTTTPVVQTTPAPSSTPSTEQPVSPVNKPSNIKGGNKDKSLKEGHSLYVSSLPFTVTEEEIRATFAPLGGDIKHIVVNKGYCFIEYSSAEAVQNILKTASSRSISIGGRDLMIEEKRPNNNKKQFKDGSKKPRDDNNRGGRGDNRKPRSNISNQNEEKKPKKPFLKETINSTVSSNPPNL